MTIADYRELLLDHYKIDLPLISFRDIVGRYFRIYGRENLEEKKPLHSVRQETDKDAITALLKLFDMYAPVASLAEAVTNSKKEKDAYKKAQDFHFVPKIGKRKLAQNEKRIAELQTELLRIQKASGEQIMGLDTQQAQQVAALKQRLGNVRRQRGRLESQLRAVENDLAFDNPRLENNFQDLLLFFPEANLKKIEDIERFHRQLARVLNSEFEEAKKRITALRLGGRN